MDWALLWLPEGGELLTESYVNLIPTMQGGTHVNGLRQGLLDAMREFCEYRNILPRGVKLSAEDIWDRCAYVLSVKMQDPQFAGQTKERLSSRQCAAFVSGVVKDAFILWLNQNVQAAELLAEMAISSAQRRMRAAKKVVRKKRPAARRCTANWLTVPRRILTVPNCSLWKVTLQADLPSRRAIANIRRSCH